MTTATDLTEMIDSLVREKTFSLDAVTAIKSLRDRVEVFEAELKDALEKLALSKAHAVDLNSEVQRLKTVNKAWEDRLGSLLEREKKIGENEKSAAVAAAESKAFRFALETVFRPNTVRETVMRQIPVPVDSGSGYQTVQTHSTSKDVVREEGA